MVHTWLLRRGLRRLLAGLILLLIGFIVFTYLMEQPFILRTYTHKFVAVSANTVRELLLRPPYCIKADWVFSPKLLLSMIEDRARQSAFIGAIGIFFLIVGIPYLLVTVVLEHMKKRRYAQRSKT